VISPEDLLAVSPRGVADLALFHGRWPFHRLSAAGDGWIAYINRWRMERPLITPLAGAFYKDPSDALAESEREVNEFLDEGRTLWVPAINPAMDGWEGDFECFLRRPDIAGFRLLPPYHGYAADCEASVECMKRIRDAGKAIFLQCRLEDERIQHGVFNCAPAPVKSVRSALARVERCRAVVCGMLFNEAEETLKDLPTGNRIIFELSFFKGPFYCCEEWVARHGAANLGYGSLWPLLTPEAAIYRVMLGKLDDAVKEAILYGNAAELLTEIECETD